MPHVGFSWRRCLTGLVAGAWACRAESGVGPDSTRLWLSPVGMWEALLLAERGRIEVVGGGADWIRRALQAMPVRDATLTREVADEPLGVPSSRGSG